MKLISGVLLTTILFFASTRNAHAIIVIVPTILVSIVNIVVIIIGVLATPVVGLSVFYSSLKKNSLKRGFYIGILILIIISIVIALTIKIVNPSRPIY